MKCINFIYFIAHLVTTLCAEVHIRSCGSMSVIGLKVIVPFSDGSEQGNSSLLVQEVTTENWCKDHSTLKTLEFSVNFTETSIRTISPDFVILPKAPARWINFSSNENETGLVSSEFFKNGRLRVGIEYFESTEYCIKAHNKGSVQVDVCIPSPNNPLRPRVKKCCKLGTMTNYLERKCSPHGMNSTWKPEFYQTPYKRVPAEENSKILPHYIKSPPRCGLILNEYGEEMPAPFLFYTSANLSSEIKELTWRLTTDGKVWLKRRNQGWFELSTDNYCVDGILNFGEGSEYRGLSSDQALVLCSNEAVMTRSRDVSIVYIIFMFISVIFLLLTALVYVSLLDLQNVHGWTILSHVTSMFFMYVFLSSSYLYGLTHTSDHGGGFCKVIGVLAHFFFLSTFCWLTLINFDLCWTFTTLNPGGSRGKRSLKQYLCYLAFALFVPTSVVTLGLTLDTIYGNDIESEILLPHYGVTVCYVSLPAQGVYVYSIVGTLLACNLILISITGVTIFKVKQSTKRVARMNTSSNQSFFLFLKLFIVMGVTWVFEIISWADTKNRDSDAVPWYWILFDIINLLQAVAIFIIFVCKRRIINQLKNKYPQLKRISELPMKFWKPSEGDGSIEIQTAQSTLTLSKTSSTSNQTFPSRVDSSVDPCIT